MTIYEKLSAVQTTLKAPKGQYNDYGNFKYRSCEDILEAVKPLCAANKAIVMLTDTVELIGNRYYIKAFVTFRDLESDAEITSTAYAREDESKKGMDGSQVTGAASSYARKYALNGLFCIDDTKDSDTNEMRVELEARAAQSQTRQTQRTTQKQTAKQPQPYEVNNPTAKDVQALAKEVNENLETKARLIAYWNKMSKHGQRAILDGYKIKAIEELTPGMCDHWSNCLKAKNIAF
ncbi:MAG: ERF family protein [Lachnospiraceae bacterium]|nr:ERF family protein [Lachnospiraceae bacterium]